ETAIRSEVSEIPGVTGIEVSAQTGRLAVTSDQPVDDAAVIAAVDEAGYAAVRS
ncbi:heavy metal transporter, partial [Burkholderia multivorans]